MDQIDEGERLMKSLRRQGFEVKAAFWLLPVEKGEWRFYLISPLFATQGPQRAYRRFRAAIQGIQLRWIDPLEVTLLEPKDPIATQVLTVLDRCPPPKVSPIRWGGNRLGDLSIDGAYLYPLPQDLLAEPGDGGNKS